MVLVWSIQFLTSSVGIILSLNQIHDEYLSRFDSRVVDMITGLWRYDSQINIVLEPTNSDARFVQ